MKTEHELFLEFNNKFKSMTVNNGDIFKVVKLMHPFLPQSLSLLKKYFGYKEIWEINKGEDAEFDNTRLYTYISEFRENMERIDEAIKDNNLKFLYRGVAGIDSQSRGFCHTQPNLSFDFKRLMERGDSEATSYFIAKTYSYLINMYLMRKFSA